MTGTVRYDRLAALAASVAVVMVSTLGGAGVLGPGAASAKGGTTGQATLSSAPSEPEIQHQTDPQAVEQPVPPVVGPQPVDLSDTSLPQDSGEGRRAVFSEYRQRVWLVDGKGKVQRTYLVSGSIYDNLDPGTYQVYSRSRNAIGVDDSGTMRFFVRFTRGETGAAIGFHDIPVKDDEFVQTASQLGTPLSHGCIRQRTRDARAMWKFAQLDTTVVVTP